MAILKENDQGIVIDEIRISLNEARYATFSRPVEFDTDNLIKNNQKVALMIGTKTVFVGWVRSRRPELTVSGERVSYEAVGPRERLSKTIYVENDSARIQYPDGSNIKDILLTVFQSGLINPVVSWTGLDLVDIEIGPIRFDSMSVSEVIESLLRRAGHFAFYIDPQFVLHIVDLKIPSGKSVFIGEQGQAIQGSSPQYNVVDTKLNFNLNGVFNKLTIEGLGKLRETESGLSPVWDRSLEASWTNDLASNNEAYGQVYRRFKMGHTNVHTGLVTFQGGPRFWARIWVGERSPQGQRTTGKFEWSEVGGTVDNTSGIVTFGSPQFEQEPWGREVSQVKGLYVYVTDPFKVVVGPIGTAFTDYGIVNEMWLIDTDFAIETNKSGEIVRDDTSKAISFATRLLEPLKDEKFEGEITINDLDVSWDLGKTVNLQNSQKVEWESIDAILADIAYSPSSRTTALTLRTDALTIDKAELKRLLGIGLLLNRLALKNDETDRVILNSKQTPKDAEQSRRGNGTGLTEQDVIDIVQAHMKIRGFCMQEHTHLDACNGGNAWAELGGALL